MFLYPHDNVVKGLNAYQSHCYNTDVAYSPSSTKSNIATNNLSRVRTRTDKNITPMRIKTNLAGKKQQTTMHYFSDKMYAFLKYYIQSYDIICHNAFLYENIYRASFFHDTFITTSNISSRFSSNSEADASELLENLVEIFPLFVSSFLS